MIGAHGGRVVRAAPYLRRWVDMTSNNYFVAIAAGLLCGWLSLQGAVAAEPDVAPAAPAVSAATQTAAPAASTKADATTAVQDAAPAAGVATPKADSAAATAAAVQPATNGDDEIVCKKQDVFGSRVRKSQVCRTKKEWQMESQAAKDYTKGVSKGSAPAPGGETLPTGG
jgi:hypothetical protein